MTHDEIRAAINAGRQAADVARESGLPITAVHHIAHGRGIGSRPTRQIGCERCGQLTAFRGGIYPICTDCRVEIQAVRATAASAVRKAVNIGMLKPAKDCVCVDCGSSAKHYDHRDYSKPLTVEPVCQSCNAKRGMAA